MNTLSVVHAVQELRQARAAESKQTREDAKREVQRLRSEGAKLLKEFRPLAEQVRTLQNQRLRLHGELVRARDMISKFNQPLDPLLFSSDEAMTEHGQQLEWWRREQRRLLTKQRETREAEDTARPRAIALANRVDYLKQAIVNLTAAAEGRRVGELASGGVLSTVEDFLDG